MSIGLAVSVVALLAIPAVWAWALNPPARRSQNLDAWLQGDLLGMPEWAHQLGITPATYKQVTRDAHLGLGSYLSELGWRYPHTGASRLGAGDPFEDVWAEQGPRNENRPGLA